MMKRLKISKDKICILIAVCFLVASTVIYQTFAKPQYESKDFVGELDVNHLKVHLLENGRDICDNDGVFLLSDIKGKVIPGKKYKESIAVENGTKVDEYVRVIVRKYWVDQDGNKTDHTVALEPELIKLSYNGKDYNTDEWVQNKKETSGSRETSVYYRKRILGGEKNSELFNTLTIDGKIVDPENFTKTVEENKTIWTYKYDGYEFRIQAEVQAVQTYDADNAARSKWGADNVTVENGQITVR